jgi:hypothetical protein
MAVLDPGGLQLNHFMLPLCRSEEDFSSSVSSFIFSCYSFFLSFPRALSMGDCDILHTCVYSSGKSQARSSSIVVLGEGEEEEQGRQGEGEERSEDEASFPTIRFIGKIHHFQRRALPLPPPLLPSSGERWLCCAQTAFIPSLSF